MKFPWTTSIVDVLKDDNKVDEKLQHVAKCKFLMQEILHAVILMFISLCFCVLRYSISKKRRGYKCCH